METWNALLVEYTQKTKNSRDFVASYRKSSSARQKIYKQSWVIIKAEFFFVFTPQLYPYFCVYANFGALLPHLFFIPCMMKNSSFIFWWEIFSAYTVLLFYVDFWVNNWCFSLLVCISARKFHSLSCSEFCQYSQHKPTDWMAIYLIGDRQMDFQVDCQSVFMTHMQKNASSMQTFFNWNNIFRV